MIYLKRYAKIAIKSTIITKIIIGRAVLIGASGEEQCGGVVASLSKRVPDVNFKSI